ncbi:MAG: hypothetical protein A2V93_12430 [Ignavibacteria bacterium RBG_16_34_14]|nr:MAG: hypothetical protein A2V93_12430 [Ignavibacteria bacterium RBG_16_34_14]
MYLRKFLLLFILFLTWGNFFSVLAQEEEEPVFFYQMEPLDDSLFILIQIEVFIDPPDPKAEIIVDLRDPNNQTVSIKGTLYPFLAFTPETRARIMTFPFKINLEEDIHYGSVFIRVFEKMRFGKLISPPTATQISPTLQYINPFFQLFGGERFGFSIKKDIGISLGVGTPYSGPLETNFVEANFHILGFFGGAFNSIDAMTEIKTDENHNNLYATKGIQLGYVVPFGNFFQVSYTKVLDEPTFTEILRWRKNDVGDLIVKYLTDSYVNFELRYPISVLASTRGKIYTARYLDEWHVGFTGREISLAGSTFDFRFDAMVKSDVRQPQYVVDILVQKIAEGFAFSAIALGPSAIFTTTSSGSFGVTAIFFNFRLKVGTSL